MVKIFGYVKLIYLLCAYKYVRTYIHIHVDLFINN
jgi:hypothetical protein